MATIRNPRAYARKVREREQQAAERKHDREWEREENRQWKLHRADCTGNEQHIRGSCLIDVVAATKAALKAAGLRN